MSSRVRPRLESGGPRVLLVEVLDALGGDAADARERTALLRSAGATVVPLVVSDGSHTHGAGATRVIESGPHARSMIRERVGGERFDRIVVASAAPGGGALADALPPDVPASWWPTGLCSGSPAGRLTRLVSRLAGRRRLPSVWAGTAGPQADNDDAAALAGATVAERDAERPCLPLWDGDVVIAPEGFQGPVGRVILEAFARLAGSWTTVDMVAWTQAWPGDDVHARRLGVEGRIHHAGPPARSAEWAWWKHSLGAVLGGTRPISRGLLLRAMTSKCPVLCVPDGPQVSAAVAPLSARGCVRVVAPEPDAVTSALEGMLARDARVGCQVEAGWSVSRTRTREAVRDALACWLGTRPRRAHAA